MKNNQIIFIFSVIAIVSFIIISFTFSILFFIWNYNSKQLKTIHSQQQQPIIIKEQQQTHIDPPPLKSYPINIRTRGSTNYSQIGTLTNDEKSKIYPLYGKQTYPGSNRWMYYTRTDTFNNVSVGVQHNNRDCMNSDNGCNELYDNDDVFVDEFGEHLNVKIYRNKEFQYIPI